MNYRDATVTDIPQLQIIRNNVKENVLSDPSLVTYNDYLQYLTRRGKGWVCEIDNRIVGFAIVDKIGNNIWALFVHSDFEKRGIGKKLLELMLAWYFNETTNTVWLTTASNTRAALFYEILGLKNTGLTKNGEIKFEMRFEDWILLNK